MSALPACMSMHHSRPGALGGQKSTSDLPWTWKLWAATQVPGMEPGSLTERPVLLNSDSPLQPHNWHILFFSV